MDGGGGGLGCSGGGVGSGGGGVMGCFGGGVGCLCGDDGCGDASWVVFFLGDAFFFLGVSFFLVDLTSVEVLGLACWFPEGVGWVSHCDGWGWELSGKHSSNFSQLALAEQNTVPGFSTSSSHTSIVSLP